MPTSICEKMNVSYIEYSPFFPNPLVCLKDVYSRIICNIPQRLPTREDHVQWVSESWERVYTSFYFTTVELYAIFLIAIGLILIRLLLSKLIFQNCLRWLHASEKNKYKFAECSCRLLFFATVSIFSVYQCFFSEEQVFFHPSGKAKNWIPGQRLSPICYRLLMVEAGYYIHMMYATIVLDTRKKDFILLLMHHIVALTVIIANLGFRYGDVAILTLLVHDIVDPPLEIAKICFYLKHRKDSLRKLFQTLSEIFFAIFAFEWTLFRMYWFPTKVLHAAMCVIHIEIHENYPFHLGFATCLTTLYCFHICWYSTIIKATINAIKGEELKDPREH